MLRVKKSIFTQVIALLLFVTFVAPAGVHAEGTIKNGTEILKKYQVLRALNILELEEVPEVVKDVPVTRGDLAKHLILLLGMDSGYYDETEKIFYDVGEEDENAPYIYTGYRLGILNGISGNLYQPDGNVTNEQMIKVIVSALGYDNLALYSGGYPFGYSIVANKIGLLSGIDLELKKPATMFDLIELFYNALEIDLMQIVSVEGGGERNKSSIIEGENILTVYHRIHKAEGQITATEQTGLTGKSTLSKDQIKIGQDIYRTTQTSINEFLGYQVEAYYKEENNEKLILYFSISEKNLFLEIHSEYIITMDNSKIVYDIGDGNIRTVKIPVQAKVLYNGYPCEIFQQEYFDKKDGSVKLLDNDNNKSYDIVFIDEYDTVIIGGVNPDKGHIYDMFELDRSIYLPEDEQEYVLEDIQGNPIDLSSLEKWGVVHHYQSQQQASDGRSYKTRLVALNVALSGVLNEISSDDAFVVNGRSYKLNSRMRKADGSFRMPFNLEKNYRFFLDKDNRIAACDDTTSSSGQMKYGYYVQSQPVNNLFEEAFDLKLYDLDSGSMVNFRIDGRITIDQKREKPEQALQKLKDGTSQHKLLQYTVNDEGKLTAIDTVQRNEDLEGKATLFSLSAGALSGKYNKYAVKIGDIPLSENLLVLTAPETGSVNAKEAKYYSLKSRPDFEAGKVYDYAGAYNMNSDSPYAEILVEISSAGSPLANEAPLLYISKITDVVGSDGGITVKFYGTSKNSILTLNAESRDVDVITYPGKDPRVDAGKIVTTLEDAVKKGDLAEGDIVRYALNIRGEINKIDRVMDYDKDQILIDTGSVWDTLFYMKKAYAEKRFGNYVWFVTKDGYEYGIDLAKFKTAHGIFLLDRSQSKVTYTIGSIDDIICRSEAGDECSEVFINTRLGYPVSLLIYK